MTSTDVPPRWDVSDVFPSLASRSFAAALEGLEADASRLAARYDEAGIGAVEPHEPTAAEIAVLDEVLAATNAAQQALSELRTYVIAFVAVDAGDEAGQAASSRLERSGAALRKLSARLAPWVAALGPEALTAASASAAEHAFALERAALRSEHQMEPAEEALYADLALTGSSAWHRLWADTTALLEADVALPAGPAHLGMAAVRGLGMHPDPAVRRAGYEAELATWPSVAVACAAAMNAIKGEADLVNARRRWDDPLDASLFANAVDRPTFEAMQAAVTDALPDFRRWLRVKARLLGHGADRGLPWWDLFAPLPRAGGDTLSWDEGVGVVTDAFASYSPQLRDVIDRATSECWLDAEPRPGKRGGAFCAPFVGDRSIV